MTESVELIGGPLDGQHRILEPGQATLACWRPAIEPHASFDAKVGHALEGVYQRRGALSDRGKLFWRPARSVPR